MTDKKQTSPLDVEEVKLHLDKMDRSVKEIKKQFSSIQSSLDAIYEDRDLLTDVLNEVSKVRNLVISADKHNEALTKDISETVENKADEVIAEVNVTSKEVRKNIINKVITGIHGAFITKELALIKVPWYKRLFSKSNKTIVGVSV